MPEAVPPATELPQDPQSWWLQAPRWLAAVVDAIVPQRASAQGSAGWVQIGPSALSTADGKRWAGIIDSIAVDPQDPLHNRIYFGTPIGGVWKTSDGGSTWVPTTDSMPSLQIASLVVHPADQSVVFAGTGVTTNLADLARSVGAYRTINATSSTVNWSQIGPVCTTTDSTCMVGSVCFLSKPAQCASTGPVNSKLAVAEIAYDDSKATKRIWAATSSGLWWSDSAADRNTAPNDIVWNRITAFPNPTAGAVPTNHVLLSPWNKDQGRDTLYASVVNSGNLNGWYRSTDRGNTWTVMNSGLPAPVSFVGRAAIGKGSQAPQDIVYAIVGNFPTTCGSKERFWKVIASDSAQNWILKALTNTCTTAATCCENPPLGCACVNGMCDPSGDCQLMRSVQMDPQNVSTVAVGAALLYRSTDGGTHFMQLARGPIHDDMNALTFVASGFLFVGSDGGFWKSTDFNSAVPTWTDLNSGISNVEFNRAGTPDALNYGASIGGTQDDGIVKGGNPVNWFADAIGDERIVLVDPRNSNVDYKVDPGGFSLERSLNGSYSHSPIMNGLPGPVSAGTDPIAMDPSSGTATTLVTYSDAALSSMGKRAYRTTNACDGTPTCGTPNWTAITTSPLPMPLAISIAVAPAPSPTPFSNLIFAGTPADKVYRTTDASSWTQMGNGTNGLPARAISSVAIDTSQPPCTGSSCLLYVSVEGFNSVTPSGHVFRSPDSGQNWFNISANLPDIPAHKVVVVNDPAVPGTRYLYLGTDMGVFQGSSADGGLNWTWATFTTGGFPGAAAVNDLTFHGDSGLLRAYTYGRSVWEAKVASSPNPDVKADNDPNNPPNTGVVKNSVKISSPTASGTGRYYAVAWVDDRAAPNNWHVYHKVYDTNVTPPTAVAGELRVDTTANTHSVGPSASLSSSPIASLLPYCSRLAWHDDRLNPGANPQHVYTQYFCSDGAKIFTTDLRVDTANVNATKPAIAYQTNQDFAVAWQADRADGSGKRDVYARFFSPFGLPKSGPCGSVECKVNSSTVDATAPAIAYDADSNVFIAWEEFNAATLNGAILIRKYDKDGTSLTTPAPVSTATSTMERHDVQLTVDTANSVLATWWERKTDLSLPDTVYMRRFYNTLYPIDTAQKQVDQPPSAPLATNFALRPAIAADFSNNFAITWEANVNDNSASNRTWNAFARAFDSLAANKKNDFRVDLVSRTTSVSSPQVTRISQSKKFAYAWTDNRAGLTRYDVYTRVVASLP